MTFDALLRTHLNPIMKSLPFRLSLEKKSRNDSPLMYCLIVFFLQMSSTALLFSAGLGLGRFLVSSFHSTSFSATSRGLSAIVFFGGAGGVDSSGISVFSNSWTISLLHCCGRHGRGLTRCPMSKVLLDALICLWSFVIVWCKEVHSSVSKKILHVLDLGWNHHL